MTGFDRRLTPYGFELVAKGGSARVSEPAKAVLIVRYTGIGFECFAAPLQLHLDQRLVQGHKITLCVDASELESYEPGLRKSWTNWLLNHPDAYFPIPILFRSKLVRMGVNMMNPMVGNQLIPCSTASTFASQVDIALARARAGRSLVPPSRGTATGS